MKLLSLFDDGPFARFILATHRPWMWPVNVLISFSGMVAAETVWLYGRARWGWVGPADEAPLWLALLFSPVILTPVWYEMAHTFITIRQRRKAV
jgi:hypothetical protein